ncbi:MAG TPA: PAS domain-containing sensor histidine kinase [Desulfobulbaceae bacterium]|nr:PAS domain-containing sensor histidine kinase [Desulfobulbaceae bacterium]
MEVWRLQEENAGFARYIREKTNQLLQVMGTEPLRPEEFEDRELLNLDPIGIIAGSLEQVFEYLNETITKLSEARDEMQAIFDATGVGISIIDQDFSIVKYNEKQRELLVDKQLDNVCGRYCYEVYCLKNGPGLDCPAVDTFATGRPVVVNEVRKKDKYFQLVTTPFSRNTNGEVTRVIEVALDITARKKAEEEEQRQRGYYLAEKSKLASVLQSLSEGLLVTDSRNRIISANGAALQILDLSQQQVLELKIDELFADCPAGARTIFDVGTPHACQNVEIRFRSATRELLLSVNSVPLVDPDGNPIGRVFTFRDITEEKHRQEVFHRTEKLAAVGQLSAGIAHELNTPLGSILGYARLLLKGSNLQPDQRERLGIIAEQAKKSGAIIRELLDFSRLSTPLPNQAMRCDLNKVVAEAIRVLQTELDKRFINVKLELSKIPEVEADPKRLEQVFVNMLLNSAQAIGSNGEISISSHCSGHEVRVSVSDSGPGISPENLSRIFDPFFTTKPVGTGTGLGLSICAGIIKDYGGAIDVRSTPEEGTSFTIILPLPGKAHGQ